MYYEALDEVDDVLDGSIGVEETREWVMEELEVARWFRENPRYERIKIFKGMFLKDSVEILDNEEYEEGALQVIFDDWPNFIDDNPDT